MKFFIIGLTALISVNISANNLNDWGPEGHRTTGEIAQKYLKKCVKRKIKKILQGESLAFVSTYADDIKSDKKHDMYKPWHYVNMPFNTLYKNAEKNPKGDLIVGIQHCIKVLKDKTSTNNDKRFFLKMLIHLIGDMHQPLHIGRKKDLGGNKIQIQWHNKGTNLHHVWDEDLIDKWGMSYTELADNSKTLTKQEIKNIQKGTVIDWLQETHKLTPVVYNSVKKGNKLGYRYSYLFFPVVREQLQKGGIRLAKVLNDIFG